MYIREEIERKRYKKEKYIELLDSDIKRMQEELKEVIEKWEKFEKMIERKNN